jgi:site-specific DNA-methyltransferase (cytosine-N4-specific)
MSSVGETVADIFCGSGTTLVEALLLKRNAIGIDANPLACLISEAKTTRIDANDVEALNALVERASRQANAISLHSHGSLFGPSSFVSKAPRPSHQAISFWFEPFAVEEIAEALAWCRELPSDPARKLALTALSSIIVTVSRQDSDTRYVRRKKELSPGEPLLKFAHALSATIHAASEFTDLIEPCYKCTVFNTNVLERPAVGQVDLIVCSPPYPNAFSYHLYHMTRMLWLGMNQHKFKTEEIGSHRKYSSNANNGATIETFRSEIETIFDWLRLTLKKGRNACFVIGNSTIKGKILNNADLISAAARKFGFLEVGRTTRNLMDSRKAFNPAIGKIKTEQILILQNGGGHDEADSM